MKDLILYLTMLFFFILGYVVGYDYGHNKGFTSGYNSTSFPVIVSYWNEDHRRAK